jgi:hypothetical protein
LKTQQKRLLGKPRHRWEDDIKMDLNAIWYEGMDWTELAQDRVWWLALFNIAMNLLVP